ncbi:MAG: AAA domain-containing protein [bacterium]|nr:AAA domain-containing protein [bacterium]
MTSIPVFDGELRSAEAVFELMSAQVPGSRWDLLHWDAPGRPRFLLGRLDGPHPELSHLDEEACAPPLVLDTVRVPGVGQQLDFGFAGADSRAEVDWFWPLGERTRSPWVCGRLARSLVRGLARRREYLGLLFADLGAEWSRAISVSAKQQLELMSIIHHPESPLVDLLEQLRRVARTEAPVFLEGESGVGKELFARALHGMSPRTGGTFVAQNGGALTDTLIESELFGHSRGSFTGAREERVGLFEMAGGGTFFLDEVGDLSPMLQVRLLRVLQDRQIRRVGENRLRAVDFRLVTATHHNMEELVTSGRFRLDLWYRIQGVRLEIPPLRDRTMDIPILAQAFLTEKAEECSLCLNEISEEAMVALKRYAWPGNVRELQNEMSRLMAFYGEVRRVERWMLSEKLFGDAGDNLPRSFVGLSLQDAQEDLERRMIRQTLGRFAGNRSRSARALGLSRQGLLKKLKRLGMERVARCPARRG